MKVKLPIALIVVLAIALGYLLGTSSGRQRRDAILVTLGRTRGDVLEQATNAVADGSEHVTDATTAARPDS